MAFDPPRASSGGVSSLRAMFENQNSGASSPDRGRTPSGSSNGDGPRKMSRIRSSFVTVEPSAQLSKKTSTESNGTSDAGIPNRERRESFSLAREEDAVAVEGIRKTVSQEAEKRAQMSNAEEAVPEVAVQTGDAGLGTPRLKASGEQVGDPIKRGIIPKPEEEGMKLETPSARRTVAQDLPSKTMAPPPEVLLNLANNLRTSPQPKPNGRTPIVDSPQRGGPDATNVIPAVSIESDSEPRSPTIATTGGKETPSEVITSTGDLQTSPGGVSPTVPRHPLVPPEISGLDQAGPFAASSRDGTPKAGARRKAPQTGTSHRATPAATTAKSPRPSRSTPNFKGTISGGSNQINRKPPTVPVAPRFSSSTRDRDGTKRTSNTSTNTLSATTSGIGFHKPRPKSPTRPIKLPSHLLAPTASSAAKMYGEQPPPSPTASAVRDRSRRVSMISERGTKPTLASSLLGRKPSGRPAQQLKSSVGPPPKKREPDPKPKNPAKAPPEGFLARMMRPTASSASKAREHREPEPHDRPHKQNGHIATAVAADRVAPSHDTPAASAAPLEDAQHDSGTQEPAAGVDA